MRQLQPERKTYTMPLKISCRSTSRSRPPGSAGSDQWRNQRPLGVGQITGVGGPGRPESPFGHGPIYPKMALSHTLLYQSNGVYSTTFLTLVRPVLGWPPWQDPGHYWTPTAKRPKWPRGSKVNRPAGGASGSWPSSLGWRAS